MTLAGRLNAWRAIVLATLACDAAYAATGALAAAVGATFLLVAMLALLATTPPDAIVLPRARSERIIVGGFAIAATPASGGNAGGNVITIALLSAGVGMLAICRRRSTSAWWAAVVLWQPIALLAIRKASS